MSHEPAIAVELPQTGRMRWVHAVELDTAGICAVVKVEIDTDHPFAQDGKFLPSALIELMAQAAAAGTVARADRDGRKIRRGMLAAIQKFEALSPVELPAMLTVETWEQKSFGQLTQALLTVHCEQTLVARALMTFHVEYQ